MIVSFLHTHRPVWGLLCLLLVVAAPVYGGVQIPDPVLEAQLREELEKPTGPIEAADLAELTKLTFQRSELHDLSGLEHCVNLTSLSFYEHNITDIACVAKMTALENLSLYRTEVSDLSPLRGLTEISQLNLQEIPTTDLSPLEGLSKLRYINVGGIKGLDLRPLSRLTSLEQLNLHSMELTDLDFAAPLTRLRILQANRNQIQSLAPLRNLHALEDIYLDDNQVSDISPLSKIESARRIYLRRNQLSDLTGFPTLQKDSTVLLMENQVTDIRPIVEASGRTGDIALEIGENPLSFETICRDVHEFEARGNRVYYEHNYQEERATHFPDSYVVCGAADRADSDLILAAVSRGISNEELEKRFGLGADGMAEEDLAASSASPSPDAIPTDPDTEAEGIVLAAGDGALAEDGGINLTLETPGLLIENHIGETVLLGIVALLLLAWRFPRTSR